MSGLRVAKSSSIIFLLSQVQPRSSHPFSSAAYRNIHGFVAPGLVLYRKKDNTNESFGGTSALMRWPANRPGLMPEGSRWLKPRGLYFHHRFL